jgi:hypothetical protein
MRVVGRRSSADVLCSGRTVLLSAAGKAPTHAGVAWSTNAWSLTADFCVRQRCRVFHPARPGGFGSAGADKTSKGAGSESLGGGEGLVLGDITARTANGGSNKQGEYVGLLASRGQAAHLFQCTMAARTSSAQQQVGGMFKLTCALPCCCLRCVSHFPASNMVSPAVSTLAC